MQTLDQQKRKDILGAAERLFATKPFHEVKLQDVASDARVGKGTIYVYFSSKEDLYRSLMCEGIGELVDRLRQRIVPEDQSSMESLRRIIAELVTFAGSRPTLFQTARAIVHGQYDQTLAKLHTQMIDVIEQVIRRGIGRGELADEHPELTARYLPGAVRSALAQKSKNLDRAALPEHVFNLFVRGLAVREVKRRKIQE